MNSIFINYKEKYSYISKTHLFIPVHKSYLTLIKKDNDEND